MNGYFCAADAHLPPVDVIEAGLAALGSNFQFRCLGPGNTEQGQQRQALLNIITFRGCRVSSTPFSFFLDFFQNWPLSRHFQSLFATFHELWIATGLSSVGRPGLHCERTVLGCRETRRCSSYLQFQAFMTLHLWSYDRFQCLKWSSGRQPGAFKRVMT